MAVASQTSYAYRPSFLESVVEDLLAGDGQDARHSSTLPPATYTSQEFFNLEMAAVYKKDWIYLVHIAELDRANGYFCVDLLGHRLVVLRKGDVVTVLDRICTVSGKELATGAGKLPGAALSAGGDLPVYDFGGKVLDSRGLADAKPLASLRTEIWQGMIYITFNNNIDSIVERLADLNPRVKNYDMANLKVLFTEHLELNFNWKASAETFAECYHHIGAHEFTAEPTSPARLSWCEPSHKGWTYCHGPRIDNPKVPVTANSWGDLMEFPNLEPRENDGVNLYIIYPGNLLSLQRRRVNCFSQIPIAPNRTVWHFTSLVSEEAFNDPDIAAKVEKARGGFHRINDEDIWVNELQQRGAESTFAKTGRLSHHELTVWDLANYVRTMIKRHLEIQ